MEKMIKTVEIFLSANNVHLTTHSGARYHYLTSNDFNYRGYSSWRSDINAAIKDGSIFVRNNFIHICGEVINLD